MRAMTPEERFERIERSLEFVAASQAQITASIQSHEAIIAENSRQIAEHSRQIAEHSRQIGELADLTLRIGRVVEEQGRQSDERLKTSQADFEERFKALMAVQAHTDERLNVLINVVERYSSNGRKQGPPPHPES